MRRVTILHRRYWKPSHRAGSSQVYEMTTLHDLSDKALNEQIAKMNEGFRTSTWSVLHDFHLDRKKDQREYLKYCIDAYYEPYGYDYDSRQVAKKMADAIRDLYPELKTI